MLHLITSHNTEYTKVICDRF